MRVDFFRVEGPGGAIVVQKLAEAIQLKDDESRTHDIGGVPFRVHELHRGPRYWEGDMVRIRMDDIPLIMARNGAVEDIDLDDDEGVGEESAFLYDTRTQVLAIQRNRSGVSASKWARFLESLGDSGAAIIPIVIPEAGAAGKISRFTQVRKVHVRYAAAANASAGLDPGGSTAEALRELANTSPVMEVTMAMGRAPGSLPIKIARSFIRHAFDAATKLIDGDARPVERIDVVATLDDDTIEVNLLDYFMREEVGVDVDEKSRRMLYADRRIGVSSAFASRRPELEVAFAPKGK